MLQPIRTANYRLASTRPLRLPLLIAAAIGVGGCSHFGNHALQITPAVFSECEGTNIAVNVKWDATSVGNGGAVRLFVYKPGQVPTLWQLAAPKGEAHTGKWASDGWTVTLVGDHGKLLGVRTLQSTPCPPSSG